MRSKLATFALTISALWAAAATLATSTRIDDPTAVFLQPGGQWLTFSPREKETGPLVNPHANYSGDLNDAVQLFYRDWTRAYDSNGPKAGPDFDAASCGACHIETVSIRSGAPPPRIARPAVETDRRLYGNQLTTRFLGRQRPEARISVETALSLFTYADGTVRQLRRPVAYAQTRNGEEIPVGLRIAPLLFGWGLLDAVDHEMLKHFHDPDDKNRDGISGRLRNRDQGAGGVAPALGWKASHEDLDEQIASALSNDIGVNHTPDAIEVTDAELQAIGNFVRSLGVPNRRSGATDRGRDLFGLTGCTSCHITALLTRQDMPIEYSDQLIWPYSDFMLHDMGPGLADPGDAEDASEWRTAPLWGIGYAEAFLPERGFLHDGRAANIEEAILWHGGEAETSVRAFSQLSASDRALLLSYVRAL